jgi:PAS domain-containing protein
MTYRPRPSPTSNPHSNEIVGPDETNVGVFRADASRKVTYVSDVWCEIGGVQQKTALGDGWSENVHPEDRVQAFAIWQKTVAASVSNTDERRTWIRPVIGK